MSEVKACVFCKYADYDMPRSYPSCYIDEDWSCAKGHFSGRQTSGMTTDVDIYQLAQNCPNFELRDELKKKP